MSDHYKSKLADNLFMPTIVFAAVGAMATVMVLVQQYSQSVENAKFRENAKEASKIVEMASKISDPNTRYKMLKLANEANPADFKICALLATTAIRTGDRKTIEDAEFTINFGCYLVEDPFAKEVKYVSTGARSSLLYGLRVK